MKYMLNYDAFTDCDFKFRHSMKNIFLNFILMLKEYLKF